MNRKGQIDLFYIIAGLFAISIIIIVTYLMLTKVNASGIFDAYPTSVSVYNSGVTAISSFDNIMLFIIVGLSLFVIISAAFVFNHPAFVIIGFVLLAIAITVAGVVSNSWVDFTDNPTITESRNAFPKTNFLMQRLPFYIFFMGIAAAIAGMVGYKRSYY